MKIVLAVAISDYRKKATPEIGLGYLAASARAAGHDVRILDCLLEHFDYDRLQTYVSHEKPDIFGIKAFSLDLVQVARMFEVVRQTLPNTINIVGGPHPTCEEPARLFEQLPAVDYAFQGEAVDGFAPFIERLAAGTMEYADIPGLVWKDRSGEIRANPKTYTEDLDAVSMPAWDLIAPRRYPWAYSFLTRKLPAAPLFITRGCPYQCTFCGSHLISGRRIRTRSIDNVMHEIRHLREHYGVRSIDIVDENFAFNIEIVRTFCERILAECPGLEWSLPYGIRLNQLDEDIVRLMERAGCVGFSVGIESGSNRVLKDIKKALSLEMVREKVRMVKRVSRMAIQGFFIIGFPTETREDVEKTIEYACSLPFDMIAISPMMPTPGTEIFDELKAAGRLKEMRASEIGSERFVHSYSTALSDEEFRALYRKAYWRFYARPKTLLNMVRLIKGWPQVKILLYALLRLTRLSR